MGNFWIGMTDKLVRWRTGSSTTYRIRRLEAEAGLSGVQDIVVAPGPGDIPRLISHFVKDIGRRICKPIRFIPPETTAALTSCAWPGNVRELQNLIEQAVIRSNDGELPNPLPGLERTAVKPQNTTILSSASGTLRDSTRSLILRTLEDLGWVIGDPTGQPLDWDCQEPASFQR
jgi:hypothetical protein